MSEHIQINFLEIEENAEYEDIINEVVDLAFKKEKLDNLNLYINIILTDPKNIQRMNKEYRNIDRPTDVLSFPMFEKNELDTMVSQNKKSIVQDVLGDIVISIEKVKEQAVQYGHGFKRELAYMVVHGFYHLMGYDHMNDTEKKIMREKEENILNLLEIKRD